MPKLKAQPPCVGRKKCNYILAAIYAVLITLSLAWSIWSNKDNRVVHIYIGFHVIFLVPLATFILAVHLMLRCLMLPMVGCIIATIVLNIVWIAILLSIENLPSRVKNSVWNTSGVNKWTLIGMWVGVAVFSLYFLLVVLEMMQAILEKERAERSLRAVGRNAYPYRRFEIIHL